MSQNVYAMKSPAVRQYDRAELWADGIIHIAGVTLAMVGAVVMLWYSFGYQTPLIYGAGLIYVFSLVAALSVSAIYNIWPDSPVKYFLRRFDHSMIYVLIAGTYTPFVMKMGADWRWFLLLIWMLAACGIVVKLLLPGRFDRLAIGLYLALGWSGLILSNQLMQVLTPMVLWLITAGGIVYSIGVIFHLWEKLRFQNAIWHSFVMAAAALHYSAVLLVLQ